MLSNSFLLLYPMPSLFFKFQYIILECKKKVIRLAFIGTLPIQNIRAVPDLKYVTIKGDRMYCTSKMVSLAQYMYGPNSDLKFSDLWSKFLQESCHCYVNAFSGHCIVLGLLELAKGLKFYFFHLAWLLCWMPYVIWQGFLSFCSITVLLSYKICYVSYVKMLV